VPILAGLHREEMAKSLPKILQMPKDAMTDIVSLLLTNLAQVIANKPKTKQKKQNSRSRRFLT